MNWDTTLDLMTMKCLTECWKHLTLSADLLPLRQRSPLIAETQHKDTDDDHGQGEHLSHGEGPEDKADVRVRFAEQFDYDTA